VELVLTNLHAGGKFGQGAYKYSGGLHGVGAKCTNALSEWFKAEVSRDGKVYHMAFAKGKTTDKLTVIGEVKNKKTTGTLITFLPDPTIFTITTEFKFERLATRLRELAFLNPGLEITLTDERSDATKKETFLYKHGIEEFVKQLGENKQVLHPKPIVISRQRDEVFVDVVLQYNDSYNDQILPFANSIPNPDGGTHLTGFRTALTKAVNQFSRQNNLLKAQDPTISGGDPEFTELYIVEGDSAGGSAKQGRDRRYQAILPIRGKLINVEKAREDQFLKNTEIQSMITAIGAGIGKPKEEGNGKDEGRFDIAKLRYGRIIIMTDADVDGSHIRTLLLTFFFRQMTELVRAGKIY